MPSRKTLSLLPMTALISAARLISLAATGILNGHARAEPQQMVPGYVDFDGFLELGGDVATYRAGRLVALETFNAMAADPDTIIIDARSAGNFQLGHINGAVNLNFADFTDESLADVIGRKDRRILIYCNNNFSDDVAPIMLKRVPLALNVPTFINLYGYGYTNIYELSGTYSITDPAIGWVSSPVQQN